MKDNRATVATGLKGFGDVSVGTTRAKLDIQHVTIEVRIRADIGNTGIIFIGKDDVLSDKTNDFVRLEAGDEHIMRYNVVDNPLYVISDMVSQTINMGVLI